MRGAHAILVKELRILSRDLHGLLVLFAMPIAFILILSLAMQDEYAAHAEASFEVWVLDADGGPGARRALEVLDAYGVYRLRPAPARADLAALRGRLMADAGQFVLYIPRGYFERMIAELDDPRADAGPTEPLQILAAPSIRRPMALLLEGAVKEAVARVRLDTFLRALQAELAPGSAADGEAGAGEEAPEPSVDGDAVALTHLYRGEAQTAPPSSVQQNVPAWLVFSMFFVVIPLSTTFIAERQHGTLSRLRSMNVATPLLFGGKLLPYLVINQLQVGLMLAVGVHLVPLLGGEALTLGRSPAGLALIALAVSAAALGFALLISVLARTTEQATVLGGAGSILLGALGGVMVPRFLMPASMQTLAWASPMAWGLEGFLDVLLREGGVRAVLPEAAALAGFGAVAVLIAAVLFRRRAE